MKSFMKPNYLAVLLITFYIPYSESVRGCTVMLQSDTSNFKVAICNDPTTDLKMIPKDLPMNVIRLEMMYQNLTNLVSNDFSHIYQLEYLTLNSCGVRYISPTAFENLNQLRVLALSNNSIVIHDVNNLQSEIFQPLISLTVLDLSHNFIQMIPKHFFHYLEKSLRVLVISNSKSSFTISPDSISDLVRLERLDVSQNNLIQLDPGFEIVFNKMISLQYLILHGNPWKCDCKMRWLVFWYQHSTLSSFPMESPNSVTYYNYPSALCHSPRSMRHALLLRSISNPIKRHEFPCYPKALSKNAHIYVNENENISLPCMFQTLDQFTKIKWSHNGTLIKLSPKNHFIRITEKHFQSVLTIIKFTIKLSGLWNCFILFDGNIVGTNYSLSYKPNTINDKQYHIKDTFQMSTTKTIALTLLGSVTLLFLLSFCVGLIYRYFYHHKPPKGINLNQKYSLKCNEISRERHNLIYNRLQENQNWNSETFEFWNLRSSDIEDDKTYVNSTVLKNPTILTSLSTDGFIVPCVSNDNSLTDSHIFVNPYIEAPATLITRTPSTTPCPVHEMINSVDSSKNDSLNNSIYHPCPLHGDMLSVILQSPTSLS